MDQETPTWKSLRDQFLFLVSDPASDDHTRWYDTWRLLLEHAWFQEQVQSVARFVIKISNAPPDWQEDVEQEVVMLLARRLRRDPSLGVDLARARHHFSGWIRVIILHDCRDAVRKLRRQLATTTPFTEDLEASTDAVEPEMRLDLAHAMNGLNEQERTILDLYSQGHTLKQVASEIDITFWRAYRMYHRGLENLHRCLEKPSRTD